jgi:hypothetical protein
MPLDLLDFFEDIVLKTILSVSPQKAKTRMT